MVSANQLEENYEEGILAVDCYNLTASGNDIDNHRGSGMVLVNTTSSAMAGNFVEQSTGWGLILRDSHANTFSAGFIRGTSSGEGIRMINSSFNTISGCCFEANDSLAMLIDKDSRQNNITANTISIERLVTRIPYSHGWMCGTKKPA